METKALPAMAKALADLKRPALDSVVVVRCTSDTVTRINDLVESDPVHTKSGVDRAALLIGLEYLEHEREGRNGSA